MVVLTRATQVKEGGTTGGALNRPPRLLASLPCTCTSSAGKLCSDHWRKRYPQTPSQWPGSRAPLHSCCEGFPCGHCEPRLWGRLHAPAAVFLDDLISSPPLALTRKEDARAAPGLKPHHDLGPRVPASPSPAQGSPQGGLLTSLGTALTTKVFPTTTADPKF